MGVNHPYVEPPPLALIQETYDDKSDKYIVKIKLRRDPTSSMSELYDFKMSLFENGEQQGFYCLCVTSI